MSTIRNFNLLAVIAKLEATYGTDSLPGTATDAIQTRNAKVNVLEGDEEELNIDSAQLGNQLMFRATNYTKLEFEVLLAGSGVAGTPPAFGSLLRACGLKETVVAVTSVTYEPISVDYESASIYFMQDRLQHKLLGARGSVSFVKSPGKAPSLKFSFTGLAVPVSEIVWPSDFDYSAFLIPVAVTDANTPVFTLNSVALPMYEFTWDVAQAVKYLNVVNQESVLITDRAPTGNVTIAEPLITEINFYELSENHTLIPLDFTHGSVAGEIISVAFPKVQIGKPASTSLDGTAGMQLPLRILPDTADDDFVLTFT